MWWRVLVGVGGGGGGEEQAKGWIMVFSEAFSKQDISATATGVRAPTTIILSLIDF